MNIRNFKSVKERRGALEKELGVGLGNIGSFTVDESVAGVRNCENMIGATQVPLGVAGPLIIKSPHSAKAPRGRQNLELNDQHGKDYYIPLATSEGALVASVSRGCKAINESGGAKVNSHRVGATRGPVFKVRDLTENQRLWEYLETHLLELNEIAQKTSSHIKLTKISSQGVGKYRFVRFGFDTQDAMGMNMATIATHKMIQIIETKTAAKCVAVAGNYDVDKKPAWLNFLCNRGIKVWAEVTIPAEVLEKVLKTSAQKIYDVWLAKCMLGSAMSGSMGFNAQYANVVAAMFLSTGQDIAHVCEGSMGITTCEVVKSEIRNSKFEINPNIQKLNSKIKFNDNLKQSLYISVYLPDLMVGTVGGGTGLATQKEALQMLGVSGGDDGKNAQKLAEIIGGAVLAGEISLLASLAEGSLANAHERLGRGKAQV